jgi:hypothetical protein
MVTRAYPPNCWRRIRQELARLGDWTFYNGSDEQKADLEYVMSVVNERSRSFEPMYNPSMSIVAPYKSSPRPLVTQPVQPRTPAFLAGQQAAKYGQSEDANPHWEAGEFKESADWVRGFKNPDG